MKVLVIASSLLQFSALLALHAKVSVLTIRSSKLGTEHLRPAGVPRKRLSDVVAQGVDPKGGFKTGILGNRKTMDAKRASDEMVVAAGALKKREPSLQCGVLECNNMPPYRQAIEAGTGLKTVALTDDERLQRPWRSA